MRKQVLITLFGMATASFYALIKVSSGETLLPYLPISSVFGIACLAMLLGIIQYDFLMVLPIARNEVFNVIGDGIVVASPRGQVLDANAAACRMLSHTDSTDLLSESESRINKLLTSHYPDWHKLLANCQAGELSLSKTTDTGAYYYQCDIYTLEKKHNKAIGTISVIRDVTEQRLSNDLLKLRAERDGLLDIYNRHTFIDLVNQQLNHINNDACLLFFDLDDFKRVNDRFGHMAGDYVLKEVCKCARQTLDDQDLLGRIGGEEFAIFIRNMGHARSLETAEAFRRRIEAHSFEYQGHHLHVTVSIGVAVGSSLSFDQFYQRADDMLYKAKEAGKNCVMI